MTTLTAGVLMAGGRSRRMGADKCLMPWNGRPLWEIQLAKLAALAPNRLVISCRADQSYFQQSAADLIHDQSADLGPLGGLVSVLDTLPPGGLIAVLGVDLPRFPVAGFHHLQQHVAENCGAVMKSDAHYEPLAAIYPTNLRQLAAARLKAGDLSMQGVIAEAIPLGLLKACDPPPDSDWFWNWNQPNQLVGE